MSAPEMILTLNGQQYRLVPIVQEKRRAGAPLREFTVTLDGHRYTAFKTKSVDGEPFLGITRDRSVEAALDVEHHSFWRANPGLRERLLQLSDPTWGA